MERSEIQDRFVQHRKLGLLRAPSGLQLLAFNIYDPFHVSWLEGLTHHLPLIVC